MSRIEKCVCENEVILFGESLEIITPDHDPVEPNADFVIDLMNTKERALAHLPPDCQPCVAEKICIAAQLINYYFQELSPKLTLTAR